MSKIKLDELLKDEEFGELLDVKIKWSRKYGMPVFGLPNGSLWIPMTGEYAGYFEEVANDEADEALQAPNEGRKPQ